MKKPLVFIFAFLYLGLSCGFAFNMHFCMGKFSSVELLHAKKDKCGRCGMETKNGCCTDKLTVAKITDNQQQSTNSIKLIPPANLVVFSYHHQNSDLHISPASVSITCISPPPLPGAFICILNSVFLI